MTSLPTIIHWNCLGNLKTMKTLANCSLLSILGILLLACDAQNPPPAKHAPDALGTSSAARTANSPRDLQSGQFHERGRDKHDRGANPLQSLDVPPDSNKGH
jgi:hypothetical protein